MIATLERSPTGKIKNISVRLGLLFLIGSIVAVLSLLPLKMAGLFVLGSIVLILSLLHPKTGLYLLIPAIPFSTFFQVNLGGMNIGPVEILLALMLATWLLKMAARRAIIIPHPPMLWPFLLFLSAIGLSWLTTFSLKSSLPETIKWIEMLALYLFICANFKPDESRWLIIVLLLAGLAQAGLGIYQFVFKIGPDGFLLFEGRFLRAYGSFNQPNPYAGYLGLVLPLALSLVLWAAEQIKSRPSHFAYWGWLILASVTFGALVAALFASQSRGGWLGFGGAIIITILAKGGKWAVATIGGLIFGAFFVLMGGLAFLPSGITQRFADVLPYAGGVTNVAAIPVTDANFAAIERLAHWQAAQTMWLEHLWLGVGFGNYAAIYPAYAVGRWFDPLGHAHNYLLNIGAEAGLIGVVGYIAFWVWILVLTIKILRGTHPNSLHRAIIIGSLGVMAHLHIHNMFDNLYVQGMYLHLTIIFGLITLAKNRVEDCEFNVAFNNRGE